MIWYIVVATFIFLGVLYKKGDGWFKFSVFVVWFFTAFRNTDLGGTDAYFYKRFFENVPDVFHLIGYKSVYGLGYTFLNSLVRTFTDNYLIYQVIYVSISILLLITIIEKSELLSNEKCLFLFIYFCYRYVYSTFVALRQNIADLIIWLLIILLFKYQEQRKKQISITLMMLLLAFSFHSTSIFNVVTIPVYYFIRRCEPKLKMIWSTLVSIIIFIVSKPLGSSILNIVIKYAGTRYMTYSDRVQGADINITNFIIRLFIVLLVGSLYHLISHKKKDEFYDAAIIAMFLGSFRIALATRYYEYFAVGMYGSLTVANRAFTFKSRFIYYGLLYIFMMIILIRFLIIQDSGAYLNYRLAF